MCADVIELALRPRAPDQGRAVIGDVLALAPYHIAFGLAIVAASLPNAIGLTRILPGLSLLLGVWPVLLALEVFVCVFVCVCECLCVCVCARARVCVLVGVSPTVP